MKSLLLGILFSVSRFDIKAGVGCLYLPFESAVSTGDGDSWKAAFKSIGVTVEVETKGIAYREPIIEIFVDHIQNALFVIQVSDDALQP